MLQKLLPDLWDTRTELNVKQTAISSFFFFRYISATANTEYSTEGTFFFSHLLDHYVYTYVTVTKRGIPRIPKCQVEYTSVSRPLPRSAKWAGTQTISYYGDQILPILRSLAECKGKSKKDNLCLADHLSSVLFL